VSELNHAIVLAAQQYLGFELCSALLEKGWTVTAVDDDRETKDKWMEIGRNANLQYVPAHAWNKELPVDCRLFLPFYDQFNENKPICLSLIEQCLDQNEEYPEVVQILSNKTERSQINAAGKEIVTTFYLPTLYGAHQPDHFLFSQLLQGKKEEELHYSDDPSGAIYVKDAVNYIIKHSADHGTYSLKSLSKNSWEEALSYITQELTTPVIQERSPEGELITVHPSKSHDAILKEQKHILSFL
jgi:hypothetical protein